MAGEQTTIARPYAEAVFKRAVEAQRLDAWSETLGLLARIVADPALAAMIADPRLGTERLAALIVEVAPGRLDTEATNLVRLLAENRRLEIVPEIGLLFEQLRHEHQGTLEVEVASPFKVDEAQQAKLAAALKQRLGRDIRMTTALDESLIGGIKIRAGDLVIDGSMRAQLGRLAHELGI